MRPRYFAAALHWQRLMGACADVPEEEGVCLRALQPVFRNSASVLPAPRNTRPSQPEPSCLHSWRIPPWSRRKGPRDPVARKTPPRPTRPARGRTAPDSPSRQGERVRSLPSAASKREHALPSGHAGHSRPSGTKPMNRTCRLSPHPGIAHSSPVTASTGKRGGRFPRPPPLNRPGHGQRFHLAARPGKGMDFLPGGYVPLADGVSPPPETSVAPSGERAIDQTLS